MGPDHFGSESSASTQEHQIPLVGGAPGHGFGGYTDPAETDHRSQMVHRHPQDRLISGFDSQCLVVRVDISALGGHIQCVEQFSSHDVSPLIGAMPQPFPGCRFGFSTAVQTVTTHRN